MKVTLLGDSIRQIGYGTKVPELLGEGFEVFQPKENCRFAKYTLRGLFDWREAMKDSDIIHWNNGLWDVCTLFGNGTFSSDEEYVADMLRIAEILVKRAKIVIFATTTPVLPMHPYNKNSDIERFNALIVPKLRAMGIRINDLYTTMASDLDEYILSTDLIHLTPKGIDVCARQVADAILEAAKEF